MAPAEPSSLLGLCLFVLVVGAIALLVIVSRARDRRRAGGDVPSPQRPAGEGPLWAGGAIDDDEDGDDEPPVPAMALPYVCERRLLTPAEGQFFMVLRAAAPEDWHVFAQVRLANLIKPRNGAPNWRAHYGRVAQKCVDFVLCDPVDFSPRLVVELDDSTHDRPRRQERDGFVDAALRAAGLPILHVRWQRRYDVAALAGQVRAAAGLPAGSPYTRAPAHAAAAPAATASGGSTGGDLSPALAGPGPRWACRSCGAEVGAAAKFCTGCGARLEI